MIRAVFEGGAYGLRQILSRGERHWGWRPKTLISVGGGTRSRGWFQIKADILDIEYLPADFADAAGMGAAVLGGIAANVFSGLDDPRLPKVDSPRETVAPKAEAARHSYDKMFAVYEKLYPALRASMAELADINAGD